MAKYPISDWLRILYGREADAQKTGEESKVPFAEIAGEGRGGNSGSNRGPGRGNHSPGKLCVAFHPSPFLHSVCLRQRKGEGQRDGGGRLPGGGAAPRHKSPVWR